MHGTHLRSNQDELARNFAVFFWTVRIRGKLTQDMRSVRIENQGGLVPQGQTMLNM
jgi:hypothetical protein